MRAPSIRASDRVQVDYVLPSGIVVSDYALTRPAGRRAPADPAVVAEYILNPGAIARVGGGRLRVTFDVLPDDVSARNGTVTVVSTRRTVEIEHAAPDAAMSELVDRLCSGLGVVWPSPSAPAVLADLVAWQAVVPERGARPRLAHHWSMRGARTPHALADDEVTELTFDPRDYGDADGRLIALSPPRPLPADSLSTVLRQRRSPTRYDGSPVSLEQVAQLLGNACGTTGELVMGDRCLPLRAYPSPGALYAVDLHVIPARVDGLRNGVYRYDPDRHGLVTVHNGCVDPTAFCLPDVRPVAEGIAAFIALSVFLPRATAKYGDESYRILVAEAGCMAQNLVLVARALGLRAGPFTGVFDQLVDRAIGVDDDGGRFVVGVLVGGGTWPT